jgi:hypothetical protein
MGNCLPKKKRKVNIDETIRTYETAVSMREQSYNSTKTSLDQTRMEITDKLLHDVDTHDMTLLIAKRNALQRDTDIAMRLLLAARNNLMLAKNAKIHAEVQSLMATTIPNGFTDEHVDIMAGVDDLSDYTSAVTDETSQNVESSINAAMEETLKYKKEKEKETQMVEQIQDLPLRRKTTTTRTLGDTHVYSTV